MKKFNLLYILFFSFLITSVINSQTPITFSSITNFTTGSDPNYVSIGDLNGDGKPDLVVANSSSNTVSVFLNTTTNGAATPTFSAKTDFTTGSGPFSISIGDLNGDGKPDLAVANSSSNTVSVFLNTTTNGATTPSFSSKTDFTTGSGPTSVSIGDLNGDGKPDLAVANSNSDNVSVFLNTTTNGATTPSFSSKTDFTTGSSPFSISIGDLNGDGKPDLVVANSFSDNISVFFNTTTNGAATPTFSSKTDLTTGSSPVSVSIGDLNGDGKPDLAVANSFSDNVSVFFNTTTNGAATPSFSSKTDFTTGSIPSSVSIGDLNGDGKPDLATANLVADNVSVFLNTTTNGAATPSFSSKTDFTTGSSPNSVSIGDLNGDGKPDLALTNGQSSLSVFFNTTSTVSTPTTQASNVVFSNISTTSVTIGWTNGNGTKRTVFVKQATTGSASPINSTTYTANTSFGDGTQIGATGWYNVFNGTGASIGITNLLLNTEYRVMVVEYNGTAGSEIYNTNSATNNPNNFTTKLAAPTLSSPTDAVVNQALNVSLSWGSVTGADKYTLEVNTAVGFDGTAISVSSQPQAGTSKAPGGLSDNTTYYWRVTASNSVTGNTSDVSSVRSFTTEQQSVSGISPATNSFSNSLSPILNWPDGPTGVSTYHLEVNTNSGFENGTIVYDNEVVPNIGAISSSTQAISDLLNNTKYYWRVTSSSALAKANTSATVNFTTKLAAPTLSSPVDAVVNQALNVSLSWGSVTGADRYTLEVNTAVGFDGTAIDLQPQPQSGTSKTLGGLNNNTEYFWRVTASSSTSNTSDVSSVFSFTTILATTDGWVLQKSITTVLLDVSFTDSSNGTAVGSSGTILRTTNGGTNWVSQTSGTIYFLYGVSFTDSSNGTAVGDKGTILRTTDGGITWVSQASGTKNLRGVSFTDSSNGTAVGTSGTILRTTDGGTTWVLQISDTKREITGVSFTDSNNGTAVGFNGTILRTTDGGITWVSQPSGTFADLRAVSFTDSSNGTVVGVVVDDVSSDKGIILRTTNGGITWVSQRISGTANLLLGVLGVSFTDSSNGTAVGFHGTILRTTDGGTNWVSQTSGTAEFLRAVSFTDLNNGTAVGLVILRTINGGTTDGGPTIQASNVVFSNISTTSVTIGWTNGDGTNRTVFVKRGNSGSASPINSITYTASTFFDSGTQIGTTGWYCVYNGTGTTVEVTNLITGTEYRVMAFEYNGTTGNEIYNPRSATNNPNNFTTIFWVSQTSGTTKSITGVSFTDSNNGTAVGINGIILRTTDGGTTWVLQTSGTIVGINGTNSRGTNGGTTNNLEAISFTDSNNGTVVGDNGTILRTTDGGTTWVLQTSGTTESITGVSFTDSNNGTAVGFNGTILRTTDGGTNWVSQTSGTTESITGVSFTDSNNGTAVGFNGTILRTTNGGTTWVSQTSGSTDSLRAVSFTDSNNGTVVGSSGTILRTTDGGTNWILQTSGTTKNLFGVSFTDSKNGTIVGDGGTILRVSGIVTGIDDNQIKQPNSFILMQNYPNPFNPTTTIQYVISSEQFVSLKIYDILGKEVATLVNSRKAIGNYKVNFNASNLTSGVYFYRIQAGNFTETKKFILLK